MLIKKQLLYAGIIYIFGNTNGSFNFLFIKLEASYQFIVFLSILFFLTAYTFVSVYLLFSYISLNTNSETLVQEWVLNREIRIETRLLIIESFEFVRHFHNDLLFFRYVFKNRWPLVGHNFFRDVLGDIVYNIKLFFFANNK